MKTEGQKEEVGSMDTKSTPTLIAALIASAIVVWIVFKVIKIAFIAAFWLVASAVMVVAIAYVVKWMRKKIQPDEEEEKEDGKE